VRQPHQKISQRRARCQWAHCPGLPVEITDATRGSGARKAASTIGQTLIQFAARSR